MQTASNNRTSPFELWEGPGIAAAMVTTTTHAHNMVALRDQVESTSKKISPFRYIIYAGAAIKRRSYID